MAVKGRVREKCLEAGDYKKYPAWFIKVLARRLLLMLIPSEISKNLPRWLSEPMFGEGAIFPPDFAWPDWMIVPPDFTWPDEWSPWIVFIFDPGVNPRTAFPPDWTPGDSLPPGVTVPPGYNLPPDWRPYNPLPPGIIIDPGTIFPPDWTPGDELPPGVIVPAGTIFPEDWTPPSPLPPGVQLQPGAKFLKGWRPTTFPTFDVFPDPQATSATRQSAAPPLYSSPFEPGPVFRPRKSAVLPSTTIHLPVIDWETLQAQNHGPWQVIRSQNQATTMNKDTYYMVAGQSRNAEPSYMRLIRQLYKFTLPALPGGAYFESGEMIFTRIVGYNANISLQISEAVILDDLAAYSSFTGTATAPATWLTAHPVIYLHDPIIDYLNAHHGEDVVLMSREFTYDVAGLDLPAGNVHTAYLMPPTDPVDAPDLVLRYRG